MASANLLALIDDIATLLDDVAVMTKVAAKKTAGILGDDLAVNAEQVSGVKADRELPVVWAVCKGSLRNKLILVPAALLISALIPWAVTPLLMLGGAFLCYEGFEKVSAYFFAKQQQSHHHQQLRDAIQNQQVDMVEFEKTKIAGAVRTDFILSAEIIAITLGTVTHAPLQTQVAVLAFVAVAMTIGVYGAVAAIVKLDDAGLYLATKSAPWKQCGRAIVNAAPYLMKLLSVLGTVAMFLVGGGILLHGMPFVEQAFNKLPHSTLTSVIHYTLPAIIGIICGAVLVACHHGIHRLKGH